LTALLIDLGSYAEHKELVI